MLALSFVALLPRILFGFLIVNLVWRSTAPKDQMIKIFLAGPLGFGLSSMLAFLWIWSGQDVRTYVVAEGILTLLILAYTISRSQATLAAVPLLVRIPAGPARYWLAMLTVAAILFAMIARNYAVYLPHGDWDAWEHYNVVSRFIFRGGENWTGTFLRSGGNADYPLLVPMSNAISWAILQREVIRAPLAFALYSVVSVSGLLFSLLDRLRGNTQAALATVVLLAHLNLAKWAAAQYADVSHAAYLIGSAGLIPLYLTNRDRSIPLIAGLMAGLAAWTKNEGLTFAFFSLLVWLWLGYREKVSVHNFVLGLVFPLVVVMLFKMYFAPALGHYFAPNPLTVLFSPERFAEVLHVLRGVLAPFRSTILVILAVLGLYSLIMKTDAGVGPGSRHIAMLVVAQGGTYLAVYMLTRFGLDWYIGASISRLYLHLLPLILLGLFLKLQAPD